MVVVSAYDLLREGLFPLRLISPICTAQIEVPKHETVNRWVGMPTENYCATELKSRLKKIWQPSDRVHVVDTCMLTLDALWQYIYIHSMLNRYFN